MNDKLNEIRTNALTQIERTERHYRLAFIAAALIEAAFFAAFIILADFSNRSHVLLLITAVATYTIIGAGLFALGLHVSRNALRVLRAIELSGKENS